MPIQEIAVEELAELIASGKAPFLLDVRTEGEHGFVHLHPSTWIPLAELGNRLDELASQRDAHVVVYCHHGIRSRTGAAILASAGFHNAVSLRGGVDMWAERVDLTMARY